jgi:hypothetical protein
MHHQPTHIKTQRFSFFQNSTASSDRGNAWHFQAWDIRTQAQVLHKEDMFKLKLDQTRFQAMSPFYASAFDGQLSHLCQWQWENISQHFKVVNI